MELRQLLTLARIASLKSFTRAADELSLTQPALTRQMLALEREMKTRLLERLGRRIELTPAGSILFSYAKEILRLVDEAEKAVSDVAVGDTGRLAVGASSTAATYLLPSLLSRYKEMHPGVEISVHTGASSYIAESVLANQVDLGIVMNYRDKKGITRRDLADYASVVVVYPGHRLAAANSASTGIVSEDLADSDLILMHNGTNLRSYVDQILAEAYVSTNIVMELDNVEAIKKMIESRLGISILPIIAVRAEIEAGTLIALPLNNIPTALRRVAIIHRDDKYLTEPIKEFIHLIHKRLQGEIL